MRLFSKCWLVGHDRPLLRPEPEYLPSGARKLKKYRLGPCRRCGA